MKNDTPTYLIDTINSKLIVWEDKNYLKKLEKGYKKREIEKEEIIRVLNSIEKGIVLKNKANGAPYLQNSSHSHISISHYGGHYAIYLSNEPVGVDIQILRDSLFKGRHYFVNEYEESILDLTKINLHLIWTAKEAFYKKNSGEIDDLKNDASILKMDEQRKLIHLKYQEEVYMLNFASFNEYVVTWT